MSFTKYQTITPSAVSDLLPKVFVEVHSQRIKLNFPAYARSCKSSNCLKHISDPHRTRQLADLLLTRGIYEEKIATTALN